MFGTPITFRPPNTLLTSEIWGISRSPNIDGCQNKMLMVSSPEPFGAGAGHLNYILSSTYICSKV